MCIALYHENVKCTRKVLFVCPLPAHARDRVMA
jgi:hypothetical protein